ncbi:acyl-CoA dehydrogenase family protein [Nocardia rhamnosiphila]|uniref:Acyl-CoA dehydrogenase family protein n=1 Tax=Nocardia rhamnosiphila TaxID=426716 RepID=A0ABV2WRF9_9NOCA
MSRNLLMDEDIRDLVTSVRAMVSTRVPLGQVRRIAESSSGTDPELWRCWAREIGVQGLLIDERHGGSGADLRAASAVATELGAGLVPGPLVPTVLAGLAVRLAGGAGTAKESSGIADGTLAAALVLPDLHSVVVVPDTQDPESGRAGGVVPLVQDGASLDLLVLVVDVGAHPHLAVVPRGPHWVASDRGSLDVIHRFAHIEVSEAPVRLLPLDDDRVTRLEAAAAILATSAQFGLMRRSLDETIAYCADRHAFGRAVGSFQAVKHQLAELACAVAQADALLSDAVAAATEEPADALLAAEAAWCFTAPMGTRVVSECLRLHGGIGYTWEHDSHLYFRRARSQEHALGPTTEHRRRLAGLLGLSA